jgi:catecholate siderophore receptor
MPAIAHAAEAEDRDYLPRDIVVTAKQDGYSSKDGSSGTKTPMPLIDVPQAINVITSDQLEDQNIRGLNQALRYVTGVSLETGEGHRDQVFIRGQSSTADFYLDGIRDDAQYYRPLYNIERIEVLKGSNALIFGRGGGGGAVNRISKLADPMSQFGAANLSLDSFGGFSIGGDLNTPLSDNVAGRLNAIYEAFDSNRQYYDGRFIGISPTFTFDLGPDTRLTTTYSYDDDERLTDRGLPSLNGGPLTGYRDTLFGDPDYNTSTVQAHVARARLEHGLADGISANATVQYAHYDKFYSNIVPSGTDGTAVTLSGYESGTVRENLIGQANLVAQFDTGSFGHTLLVGIEAMGQDTDSDRNQARFNGATSTTVPLEEMIFVPAFTLQPQRASTSSLSTFSFYVQEQLEIAEFLQLVAGIRYEEFDLESTDLIGVQSLARVDKKWSPRFGVILKPSENVSFYASYSESFLPQSGDQFTVLSTQTAGLDPEEFRNYEIGLKWSIEPELFLTAAIFQLDRSNTRASDPLNSGFVILTGESRVKGFELSLAGSISDAFHLSAGYTYLDGEITSDTTSAPAGTRLQQLPEHQVSLWSRYDFTEQLGLGLGVVGQSEQFTSTSNAVTLPGYVRVDAAIYFDVNENVALQLNVENLFDREYFASAHGDNNIQPGTPLGATLGARLKF